MENENLTPFAKRFLKALESGERSNLKELVKMRQKKIEEKNSKKDTKRR